MTYEEEKAKLEAEILEHVKAGRADEAVTAGENLKHFADTRREFGGAE